MPKDSKEGRDKLLYVESKKKKKRYKLTYLQKNSSRVTDVEYKLTLPGDTWGEG